MAMLASARGGQRLLGWRDWLAALLVVWIAPALLGAGLVGLGMLFGGPEFREAADAGASQALIVLFLLGYVLLFSPVLSWIGLLIALPLVWMLLRFGLAGWLNMASMGAIAGLLAAGAVQGFHPLLPMVFGTLAALGFRAMLRARKPQAFTPC